MWQRSTQGGAKAEGEAQCVLPEERRGGRVAHDLSPMQGIAAIVVQQLLGDGLGSQQRLHARLVPAASGSHQSGDAADVLKGVG